MGEPTLHTIDKKIVELCTNQKHMNEQLTNLTRVMEKHIDQADQRMKEEEKKSSEMEKCLGAHHERIEDNKSEVDNLRGKSNILDALLFIATIVLGALGIDIKP